MKKTFIKLTNTIYNCRPLLIAIVWLIIASPVIAQDDAEEKKSDKPERPAFESAWWFDGQTGVLYQKKNIT